jgi:hypothetical protein
LAEVVLLKFSETIFSLESQKLGLVQTTFILTIEPFEAGVRLKVLHRAKDLPELLDSDLLFGRKNKDFPQFLFRFGTEPLEPQSVENGWTYI